MKKMIFFKDELSFILLQVFLLFFLAVYLYLIRVEISAIFLLLVFYVSIYAIYFILRCLLKQRYFTELFGTFQRIEKKHLITEVVKKPFSYEGKLYFQILKGASQYMNGEIAKLSRENLEYREFIEKWVHEINTPITGLRLICENHSFQEKRKFLAGLVQVETYVDQVLYYARMGNVYKDYFIKPINLETLIYDTLSGKQQLLILNQISVETQQLNEIVLTDQKWLSFLIGQILMNSIKYRQVENPQIRICSVKEKNTLILSITDNGIGISGGELKRVFEKGFTGSNGRRNDTSTGMGLYLCKEICTELGIQIRAESKLGEFTNMNLIFRQEADYDVGLGGY